MDDNTQEKDTQQTEQNIKKDNTPKLKTWGDIRNDILTRLKKEEWV